MSTYPDTSAQELENTLAAAQGAAREFSALRPRERAAAVRAAADALDAAADELVPVAREESHLPEPRLRGELARTTFQLRLFAELVEDGGYLRASLDTADPEWPPGARPDLRRMMIPLGPVVVFGASNFPFAFSVAGGDTAAALAAGCPVIVKAHPGHPELSTRTARIVAGALAEAGAPKGVFSLIHGEEAGRLAVQDPRVKAGAFTGSLAGGRALGDLAASRPEPIPFYAEMESLNPVFVTERAAAERGDEVAEGYAGSYTMGAGQFCTKPGLLFVPEGSGIEEAVAERVRGLASAQLLNDRVMGGYDSGLERLSGHDAVRTVVPGGTGEAGERSPALLATTVDEVLRHGEELMAECFGPASLLVTYTDEAQLVAAARALRGQLTATVQGTPAEAGEGAVRELLDELRDRAGRVLWNSWPTGVAVTHAMHHGGPYPATSVPLHTSVGTAAIERFMRPVTYQAMPDELLPEALRDANPLGVPRSVNGGAPDRDA
ncbi:NADP-dependent aldehyde dehydrogenase [Spinactinospora alkalitolerans]|uniref:NADP-dependent aldehyde dehydrogenase n=1 Tax=Spinactinospora alkalitolerans TaxID=687207 RepID=A0A852U1Y2_9ACTN|nr:aldehyde dehydrogenase (NADP(+)) [Spinactinospora alkalitolerans]NYE50131.1 NADP-dependent aldehyde dehydrogenase [Spinactinospora alkalitolerans]